MSRRQSTPVAAQPVADQPVAVPVRTATDVQILAALANRFRGDRPLPATILEYDGSRTPITDWLEGLALDHRPCPFTIASNLGLRTSSPVIAEAAFTLRARLIEQA